MRHFETDYELTKINGPGERAVHAYFDLCPESPDGRWVAYCALDSNREEGWVIIAGPDGTGHRRVGRSQACRNHHGAMQHWGGGAHSLVYQESTHPAYVSVMMDIYTERRRRITAPIRMAHPTLPIALGHPEGPGSILPTERDRDPIVVYHSDLESGRIFPIVRWREMLSCHPLKERLLEMENLHAKHTKWSPDGERFFFVVSNEPHDRTGRIPRVKSLFVCDREGRMLRYLHEFGHHPMWMPDGRAIYAYERVAAEQQILRLFPVDGGATLKREIDMPRGIHASIDPRGRWMVTDAFLPERAAIYLIDPANDRRQRLVQFPCEDFSHETGVHPHPAWSRDGMRIYFNAPLEGSTAVMALDLGQDPWSV